MRQLLMISLMLVVVTVDGAIAWDWIYDHERDDDLITSYSYPEENGKIRAKFIFVSFPDVSPVLTYNEHGVYVDLFNDYFTKHSNGKLTLHEHSGVLLPPGEHLDENTNAQAWVAQLPAIAYRTDPPYYIQAKDDTLFWDYEDDIGSWTTGGSGYASPLFAEILYKIYQEYLGSQESNPFSDPGNEPKWELYFVFLLAGQKGPYSEGVGGRPDVHVRRAEVLADTPWDGEESFYKHLTPRSSLEFGGAGQVGLAHDYTPSGMIYKQTIVYYLLHEFAHTLGLYDGPPNLAYTTDDPRSRYFHGNLNLMSQHFPPLTRHGEPGSFHYPPFHGYPPLGDFWLTSLPWNTPPGESSSVRDVTGEFLYGHRIYDVTTGGQMVGVKVHGFEDEYFLLAYHGGHGVDGYHDFQGLPAPFEPQPVVPSQGLAIWHCFGNPSLKHPSFVSLEAATGLYDYPGAGILEYQDPWFIEEPSNFMDLYADPETGYDGYDGWIVEIDGVEYTREDWGSWTGGPGDFFRIDIGQENPNHEHLNNDEFSYRTNPNCFGYSRDTETNEFLRRRPQNVPNSLVIKIRSMGVDPARDNQKYLEVDILFAPSERLTPAAEATLQTDVSVGTEIELDFIQDYLHMIDSVNVLYSATGGNTFLWPIAEGVVLDPNNPVFNWVPMEQHWSEQGKLRFEFVNELTDEINQSGHYEAIGINNAVGYYETAVFPFQGQGVVTVLEEIVTPNGGEILYEGLPGEIRWTKYLTVQPDSVAVHYDLNETGIWQEWMVYRREGSPTWNIDLEANEYVALATPTAEMCASNVRIKLTFYEGGREASTVSEATFEIYPTPIMYVEEDPEDHGVDYDGLPYATAVFDFNNDGKQDVLVTIEQELSGKGLALYRNERDAGETNLRFEDVAAAEFSGPLPDPGFRGLAVAAHDSASNIKIFMAHEEFPALFVKQSDNKWHNVINDPTFFDPNQIQYVANSYCATWVDINRDGHLDLYVGRGIGFDEARDAVFIRGDALSVPRFNVDHTGFGFGSGDSVSTRAISWSDFDGDGLWDLAVSGARTGLLPGATFLYWREDPAGDFNEVPVPGFQPVMAANIGLWFVDWVDYNQNNGLELVIVNPVTSLKTEILVFENPAISDPLVSEIPMFGPGQVGDLDLDGRPDIVLITGEQSYPTTAVLNVSAHPDFDIEFAATSTAVGLGGSHPAKTIALADFGGDGDLDLILGTGQYFDYSGRVKRLQTFDGGEAPQNNWLGVRLDGQAEDNPWGIGATISLFAAGELPLGSQIVHGGGGRGGQPSPTRIFGLGSHNSNVQIKVRWPLGFVQEFDINASNLNSVVTVTQSVGCELDEDSVNLEIVYNPDSSTIDWIFTWTTDRWTKTTEDRVTLTRVHGSDCGFETAVLQAGTSDDVMVMPVQYVTNGEFHHEIRWLNQTCLAGCTYSYVVRSWDGRSGFPETEVTSTTRQIRFRVCPSSL